MRPVRPVTAGQLALEAILLALFFASLGAACVVILAALLTPLA
mgnify:CR=1 FL=1